MSVSLIFSANFAGEITRRDRPQSSLFPPVLIYIYRRVPYHWLKIPSHPISFSLIQVAPSFSLVDRIDNDTLCKNLILIQRCPEELEIFLTSSKEDIKEAELSVEERLNEIEKRVNDMEFGSID